MGREVASALGRWFVLESFPVEAELIAICDLMERQREWFRQVPTVKLVTADYHDLCHAGLMLFISPSLRRAIRSRCIERRKGPAEKPFGIDRGRSEIAVQQNLPGGLVRCSSNSLFPA